MRRTVGTNSWRRSLAAGLTLLAVLALGGPYGLVDSASGLLLNEGEWMLRVDTLQVCEYIEGTICVEWCDLVEGQARPTGRLCCVEESAVPNNDFGDCANPLQ